jgi:LmbE family N-acetylglucosaminyl deacetylase
MKILIINSHPDDALLSMGGSIAKFIEEGNDVHYVVFSWAGQGFNKEEIMNSLKILGLKESHIRLLNYEVRNFPYFGSAIRQEMVNLRDQIKPDKVFINSSLDLHQDHETTSKEGYRVFRELTLFGYILPWNVRELKLGAFQEIEPKHLDIKLKSIKALNSQQFRFYYNPEVIKAMATMFGLFRRKKLAEGLEIMNINL